jgi:sugar/nucleoside kinase (ribokinase family)
MRHREQRPAEPAHRDGPAALVDLVLIGHVGSAMDRTPRGTATYTGGSGFAAAFAASALLDRGVGLVTQVGEDFDLASLRRLPIDLQGVAVRPGASATFVIDQFRDGSLSFRSDLGVAAEPAFGSFPASYFRAKYVHLGTAPPRQQLAWLGYLRDRGFRAQISVDMFEPFVAAEPGACRQICDRADLIFLNEAEYRGLFRGRRHPSAPTLLKHGRAGAELLADGARQRAGAAGRRGGLDRSRGDPRWRVPRAARPGGGGRPRAELRGRGSHPVSNRIRGNRPGRDPRAQPRPGRTGRAPARRTFLTAASRC